MDEAFLIDHVREDDAAAIIGHFDRVGDETDLLTFAARQHGMTVDDERAYIRRLYETDTGFLLRATLGDELVATTSISWSSRLRIRHVGTLGIAVVKTHWGKGLGRAMCVVAIAEAAGHGVERIELRVRDDNATARRLYESLGFAVEARMQRDFRVGETYFDSIAMARLQSATLPAAATLVRAPARFDPEGRRLASIDGANSARNP